MRATCRHYPCTAWREISAATNPDPIGEEGWHQRLRDATAFYTNQSKFIFQDEKTLVVVWSEMEAFELLMEAEDFEKAAELIIDVTPLLDRWNFKRFRESLYNHIIPKVKLETQSILLHNLGILLELRGDYGAALDHYQRSLKIKEELGDRPGVASSKAQIGNIFTQLKRYPEALEQATREKWAIR
jgi:tetratricopeptide (TPR) repeat protein